MAGVQKCKIINVPLKEAAKGVRKVPLNHPLIASARSLDTSFGDRKIMAKGENYGLANANVILKIVEKL